MPKFKMFVMFFAVGFAMFLTGCSTIMIGEPAPKKEMPKKMEKPVNILVVNYYLIIPAENKPMPMKRNVGPRKNKPNKEEFNPTDKHPINRHVGPRKNGPNKEEFNQDNRPPMNHKFDPNKDRRPEPKRD